MNRKMMMGLTVALLLSFNACAAGAEETTAAATTETAVAAETAAATDTTAAAGETAAATAATASIATQDGLLTITLPGAAWCQVISDDNTEMFSDGDCAILVNLYKNGDTLPVVQCADENHALVYTAAASTQEYVLYVVGYANAQTDFAGICDSINSIKVDSTKITDDMLNHTIDTSEYSITQTNYTAWVSTEGLNVRSASEDGDIIASLAQGDQVTVTGTVTRNGAEIGWVKIQLSDGTEGYVSSQFLSTTEVSKASSSSTTTTTTANSTGTSSTTTSGTTATQTGNSVTVYGDSGTAYVLYEYSDGTWKSAKGTQYWQTSDSQWGSASGDVLYNENPNSTHGAEPYRTGYYITLLDNSGNYVIVYDYSDGVSRDDNGDVYEQYNNGQWQNLYTGEIMDVYDPDYYSSYSSSDDESVTVYSEEGDVRYLTYSGSDIWYDQYGVEFYRYNSSGTWISGEDIFYYE